MMQKDIIIQKLKERGCRITKQRLTILDIILEEECSCCKEIYYKAAKKDSNIGFATVYRMVNMLEEIGAISRKNMYKINCSAVCRKADSCQIELSDDTVCELSSQKWNEVILAGLRACGYVENQEIRKVVMNCE